MPIFELLDDQRKALKEKKGEVADLHWEVELSAAGKAATGEISRLKVDLDHEAVVHSSQEELEQLRGARKERLGDAEKGLRAPTKRVRCRRLSKSMRRCVSAPRGQRLP